MRLVKLTNQVTGRALNSNWARQAHARAMYPTSLFKQRRLSGLTQSGCVLWGIAYGNIMLWDGRTWGYIRKQHLIWRNQLHNVYNVDRCIANSNILYVTCSFVFGHTGFPPYHTGSWSWSPFWPVSLQKLLNHIMKVWVPDEFWLILP